MGLIIASNFIQAHLIENACCVVSSHNLTSEKQFRYPTEYGAPRPDSATFTSTGAAACFLTNEKTEVRIECATLGRIMDYQQNDPNDMGKVMAPAAIDTLKTHFEETGRTPKDYDLIITGDLGLYGMEIVKDYMISVYQIDLSHNYNDCGVMLYDLDSQKEVKAGGSGPVCSALVMYSYLYDELKKKNLKKILFLATGALFCPNLLYQKENINSICHAISLFNSFLFCGFVCMISQIVLDNSKLTPGHITSILVVLGAFLDSFSIYDEIIKVVGGGAQLPITSFGHSLIHGALAKAKDVGFMGIFMGMFDLTATGISAAILFSFLFTLFFKPKD